MGVPPEASVIVSGPNTIVVVVVGTAMTAEMPDRTKVCDIAVVGGYGLGSSNNISHNI